MTKGNIKASKIKTLETFFPDCSFAPTTIEPARIARFSAQEQRARINKLEKLVERLTTRIDELRNPAIAQLNVTARRSAIAASMYQDSERLELLKEKMLAMIKLIESNNLPRRLAYIKDRTQLELLLDAVNYERDYRCHYPRVQREDLEKVLEQTKEQAQTKAWKQVQTFSEELRKKGWYWQRVDEKTRVATEELLNCSKITEELKKRIRKGYQEYNRLQRAKLDTAEKFEQAKRDFKELETAKIEKPLEVIIKEKRRDIITGAKIPGFFPTPEAITKQMLEYVELEDREDIQVLEPSAGYGSIIKVVREQYLNVKIDAIEINYSLRGILEQLAPVKNFQIVGNDFLEYNGKKYDCIIMNPPFGNEYGQFSDAKHIKKAYELLKGGGRVVSIACENLFFRKDKAAREFREWLEAEGGESVKLEAEAFKTSERSTGVATRIVIIEKD